MKVANILNMLLNQILNLVVENLASDPTTPTAGRIYFNTTDGNIRFANGTGWQSVGQNTGSEILALLLAEDGAGSGLDADLLDGMEASAFALLNHTHTSAQITDLTSVIDGRITAAFSNDAVDATVDTIAEFTQLIRDNEDNITAILSIKRHVQLIGDGAATSIPVTHALATQDCIVQVVEAATEETVIVDAIRTDVNTVTIVFGAAPATDSYKVIILA